MTLMDTHAAQAAQAQLDEMQPIDSYQEWQKAEGVPSITGFYIDDLKTTEVHPWARKGVKGVFINLDGTGGVNDMHLVEIPAGGETAPERHLYEEMIYVVSGRGSTSVWLDPARKHTFEWGRGSVFAIPLNAYYQHFNGSGTETARLASVTNAPTMLKMFHNADFVFNTPYEFTDRFGEEDGYFSGNGKLWKRRYSHIWETNFVPDVHTQQLHSYKERGAGGANVQLALAQNSMGAHISQFPVGTYKKGHRHGPGAHVIILDGDGYSLLWKNVDDERIKCDWRPGAVVVPPDNWFHQHFNSGANPARYLALRYTGTKFRQPTAESRAEGGSGVSIKLGGWQIEYEDEDPQIHTLFESELKKHNAPCRMKAWVPSCTGEAAGPEALGGGGD